MTTPTICPKCAAAFDLQVEDFNCQVECPICSQTVIIPPPPLKSSASQPQKKLKYSPPSKVASQDPPVYHVARAGQVLGNWSPRQIERLYRSGTLMPEDHIFIPDSAQWVPLHRVISALSQRRLRAGIWGGLIGYLIRRFK